MGGPAAHRPRSLVVGERLTVRVAARSYWNDTGLEVVEDAVYKCHAEARWLDMPIETLLQEKGRQPAPLVKHVVVRAHG